MNHETTDFAAQRFAPRQASDPSYFYAGRHFKPQAEHRGWVWMRNVVCLLVAAGIGAMLALAGTRP